MIPDFFPNDPRDYLREELNLRQQRRPQYSMRAFARDLNMSPSSLCEFLAGRQGLSKHRVKHISERLGMQGDQQEHFLDLVEAEFGRSQEERRGASLRAQKRVVSTDSRLALERFHLVADWHHFAILELLGLPKANFNVADLARILGLTEGDIRLSLERMQRLDLVQVDELGRYLPKNEVTIAGGDVPDEAIRLCHRQTLLMQARALEEKSMKERESVSVTLKIAQSEWDEFRREMRRVLLSVASKYGAVEAANDQVVALSMQMVTLVGSATEKCK